MATNRGRNVLMESKILQLTGLTVKTGLGSISLRQSRIVACFWIPSNATDAATKKNFKREMVTMRNTGQPNWLE